MDKNNEIILFENQGVKLKVSLKDETVWLNRQQLSELFDRDIKANRIDERLENNDAKEILKVIGEYSKLDVLEKGK